MVRFEHIWVSDILGAPNRDELFSLYSIESKGSTIPETDVQDNHYLAAQDAGLLDSFGMYYGETLVGFCTIITQPVAKHGKLSSTVESLFILREHRGNHAAKQLIDLAASTVKAKGSTNLFISAPIGGALERVAPKLGFVAANIFFSKEL